MTFRSDGWSFKPDSWCCEGPRLPHDINIRALSIRGAVRFTVVVAGSHSVIDVRTRTCSYKAADSARCAR
jgi:hypothetical protein